MKDEQDESARWIDQKPEFVFVEVSDKDGHIVGSFHKTGILMRNGEIGTRVVGGTFDYIDWAGPLAGRTIVSFDDGSTITYEWEGDARAGENNNQLFEGTYRCANGTGRFKDVACEGTWKETVGRNGMRVGESQGKITPAK